MHPIKQSTAITVPFFVHDASGDAVTGLLDAGFTKRISKGSGAYGAMTVTISEMENGWYSFPLSTSHADTLGLLSIVFTHASSKQVNLQFRVHARLPDDLAFPNTSGRGLDVDTSGSTEANVTLWNGSAPNNLSAGNVPSNVAEIVGDSQSATDLKDFADAGYDPVTNKVQGVVLVDTTITNTDMRGTDNAALASVLGALADAAAAGDPTSADTVVQYLKQLVNVLVGTTGVTTFPAEAAPANNVSLAEVIRAMHADVTGLNGDAMRGTDSAATAAALATAQTDLDTITGSDGVTLATAQANYAPATAAALTSLDTKVDTIDGIVDNIRAGGVVKNAAYADLPILMVDATDGITPETGLTVAGTRSIDGGAFASIAGTIAEVSNGVYSVDLAAADTNGDSIIYRFTGTGARDTFVTVKTTT